ncbi:hypothetical protein DdX_20412 [Ditylenchus destructor]|uniref:Uncharacterized protein n=1 Tax=Ditylenchus destructor TaxID=166010 RepID=A0AAD4QWE1_9BILA|nr:hypothetical protein DdX_20412 [Ditylenchus destructor]
MSTRSQPTCISKEMTRFRCAQCQTEFDPNEPTVVQLSPETQAKHQMLLRPRRKQNRCPSCSNSPCRCARNQLLLSNSVEMRMSAQPIQNATMPTRDLVQSQVEPDPSKLAVTDSSDEKLRPHTPETELCVPGVSRAELRKAPRSIIKHN